MHQQTRTDHIGNGIDRADFMEVDAFKLFAVRLRLRLGDDSIDRAGVPPDFFRHRQRLNPGNNIFHGKMRMGVRMRRVFRMAVIVGMRLVAVIMIMVVIVVAVRMRVCLEMFRRVAVLCGAAERDIVRLFFLSVDFHRHLQPRNAAFFARNRGNVQAFDAEVIHCFKILLRCRADAEQRCIEHIARSAHIAFEIQCFHRILLIL